MGILKKNLFMHFLKLISNTYKLPSQNINKKMGHHQHKVKKNKETVQRQQNTHNEKKN